MPRLHLKRLLVAGVFFLLLCLLTALVMYHQRSKPYYRGVPDVDPELWKLLGPQDKPMKKVSPSPAPQIHIKHLPSLSLNINWTIKTVEHTFFRYLENKDIRCEKDVRLGNWNEGGWNVCMTPPFQLKQPCVVFSFGIGYDWQFEDSVSNTYSCQVLAFDPSMPQPAMARSALIEFHTTGLGATNGIGKNGWKFKTLAKHILDEGYLGVHIDYVKIDVEYMEWDILKQAVTDGSLKLVKQLAFEVHTPELFRIFHQGNQTLERNPRSEKRDFLRMFEILHQLENLGFKKFNYRKNPFGNYKSVYSSKERSCCYELHYINTDFLQDNNTVVHWKDSKLFHR